MPGALGDFDEFRSRFMGKNLINSEDVEYLRLKTRPLVLRRSKKEILSELPDKQESKVLISFEEKQKRLYRDIAMSYNESIRQAVREQGEAKCQLQMLTALLRLRQACSDPAALPKVTYAQTPPKIETLLESASEIIESGESILVFTQFLQTLERTVAELKRQGIPVFCIHGGISRAQREKILTEFNSLDGGAVLAMTLKTGGVGLNLNKASYVFHLEPWWNPAVENQATDRAHRIGQKRAVQVFRYIMHESVEEKIEVLKKRKDERFQSIFSDTEVSGDVKVASSLLSQQDFEFLLKS